MQPQPVNKEAGSKHKHTQNRRQWEDNTYYFLCFWHGKAKEGPLWWNSIILHFNKSQYLPQKCRTQGILYANTITATFTPIFCGLSSTIWAFSVQYIAGVYADMSCGVNTSFNTAGIPLEMTSCGGALKPNRSVHAGDCLKSVYAPKPALFNFSLSVSSQANNQWIDWSTKCVHACTVHTPTHSLTLRLASKTYTHARRHANTSRSESSLIRKVTHLSVRMS